MYKNLLLCYCFLHTTLFKTINPSISGKKGIFVVIVFPKREVHGGNGKRQRENTKKNVLDFSASINPFPPMFEWHCDPAILAYYPDDRYTELKKQIASTFNRTEKEICVGNGSIELIRVFCSVALKGKDKTFFTESPTFGEYALSARLTGACRVEKPHKADVSFICNPNNPTGRLQKKSDMKKHLECMKSGGLLFCDEAFIELSDPAQSMADVQDPNLFVLHSLTKSFSVPGIRFGYGFGDPDIIDKIEITRPPWSVNAFAEAYATEAFKHIGELATSRAAITRERDWLADQINALGMRCNASSANYILVEYGRNVTSLCAALARDGVLVRDCTSFELPTCIRVAVRTREENQVLLEALSTCMH
jgi:threonine-phosphate decarboxylase